jgi:hypothetical protein
MWDEFLHNVLHNLFKPLLLFFYTGFLIPIFRVKFEFPKPLYKALTIYLLVAIGWHGGEELAGLPPAMLGQAGGLMIVGFLTNLVIGILAYTLLRFLTRVRAVDAATISGYYGSDSAGTFVTCLGMLTAVNMAFAPYMPVLLAVMEIPGCLVALYLVSRLRRNGMDAAGNMPGEPNYGRLPRANSQRAETAHEPDPDEDFEDAVVYSGAEEELVAAGALARGGHHGTYRFGGPRRPSHSESHSRHGHEARRDKTAPPSPPVDEARRKAEELEDRLALEDGAEPQPPLSAGARQSIFSAELLHEVFLNPGIFLLFAGVAIGFLSRLQGEKVTAADDPLFVHLFQGVLCLFLLEMGITASSKLRDLKTAGWQFVAFGLLAPNLFAGIGITVLHTYSLLIGQPFEVGTYVLFAVLCGAASYIAVPAVQRLAIPEASPTLPLAASLGLTFTYNVTIGIPLYMMAATALTRAWPVL